MRAKSGKYNSSYVETQRTNNSILADQDTLVSLKPTNPRDRALERLKSLRSSGSLVAEKGFHSLSHYNLAHKPVPIPRAMQTPDPEAAVG